MGGFLESFVPLGDVPTDRGRECEGVQESVKWLLKRLRNCDKSTNHFIYRVVHEFFKKVNGNNILADGSINSIPF